VCVCVIYVWTGAKLPIYTVARGGVVPKAETTRKGVRRRRGIGPHLAYGRCRCGEGGEDPIIRN